MKAALLLSVALVPSLALAAGPQWTWEAGKQSSNGAITIKSTNGSTTYTGTQNPTGAVAKTNQNAVTQPPTVIIQATSGGAPFNYKDDCWIINIYYYSWIGAGKVDTTLSQFTGVLSNLQNAAGQYNGASQVMSALIGTGFAGNSTYGSGNPLWCGPSANCAVNTIYNGTNALVLATAMPIGGYQKCYP